MSATNDGGPAFPGFEHFVEVSLRGEPRKVVTGQPHGGMSLRDYFAAHAPIDRHDWFAPTMPPRPIPRYDHNHPNEPRCTREWDCSPANAEELGVYDDERRRQYDLQWPYAYADAMIAERAK